MVAHTTSVCKGRGSIGHNNREFLTPNVDKSRTHLNVIYKQEPISEAYNKVFGEEVARYNLNQKRSDRKIQNYMEHIKHSKNGEQIFYETIVQIGNKYTCNVLTKSGEQAAKILDEYMKEFQNRNPNLYVFNAVLHLDEKTPHIHIDYFPVARGYKQGLQVRNSLDKALKQQGIDGLGGKKKNSTQNWQESEKQALGEIMERYGWKRAVESGIKREKMTVSQYKATMREIEQHVNTLPEQIERKVLPLSKGKVLVSSEELDELELRAKLSIVHEEAQEKIQEDLVIRVSEADDYVKQRLLILQMEKDEIEHKKRETDIQYSRVLRKEEDAKKIIRKYTDLYNAQSDLNKTVDALKIENSILKEQVVMLKNNFSDFITKAENDLRMLSDKWNTTLSRAYDTICMICKAVGMLKYDKKDGYGISLLNKKQSALIDAVANYGANIVRTEGQNKIAEDIEKHIGISQPIYKEV